MLRQLLEALAVLGRHPGRPRSEHFRPEDLPRTRTTTGLEPDQLNTVSCELCLSAVTPPRACSMAVVGHQISSFTAYATLAMGADALAQTGFELHQSLLRQLGERQLPPPTPDTDQWFSTSPDASHRFLRQQSCANSRRSAEDLDGADALTLERRSEVLTDQRLQAWRQAPVRAKPDKACTSGLVAPLTEPLYTLARWEQGYELVSEQTLKRQSADQLPRTGRSRACCRQAQLVLP